MGRQRCCCEKDCVIVEDGFNRASSTNLGPKWEETAGNSRIINNSQLEVPAGGIVITTARHPRLHWSAHVRVLCIDAQPNKRFRIRIDILEDASPPSFAYGEIWFKAAGKADLIANGGHTVEVDYTAGEDYTLVVCRSDEGLYVSSSEIADEIAYECVAKLTQARYKAGLENPGAAAVVFDDFYWQEHWTTNADCPKCYCECRSGRASYCMPKALTATYVDVSGDCACIEGEEIPLTWVPGSSPARWEGSATLEDWFCTGDSVLHELALVCDDHLGECEDPWHLCRDQRDYDTFQPGACTFGPGELACNLPSGPGACPASVSCDPFYLRFPVRTCDAESGETCAYTIEITE